MTVLLRYLTFIYCVSQVLSKTDPVIIYACLHACVASGKPFQECSENLSELLKSESCNFTVEYSTDNLKQSFKADFAFRLEPDDAKPEPKPNVPHKINTLIQSEPIIIDNGCPIESHGSNITVKVRLITCSIASSPGSTSVQDKQPTIDISKQKCMRNGMH